MTGYCNYCNAEVAVQIKERDEQMIVAMSGKRLSEFPFTLESKRKYAYCPKCGREVYVQELHDANAKAARDVIIRELYTSVEQWERYTGQRYNDDKQETGGKSDLVGDVFWLKQ